MTDWHERNRRRETQRKGGTDGNRHPWREGHRERRQPISYPGKGEMGVLCENGAFGNLLGASRERYRDYARGTDGELGTRLS